MGAALKKETLGFLKQLEKNNNREWFNANKPVYLEALADFTEFISYLIVRIASFDKSVSGVEAKSCIFRIYKDTRFAKDKTPYKTHFGAYIEGLPKDQGKAGYYFHAQPKNTFLAGGLWHPEPDRLKIIREDISADAKGFNKILNDKTFKQYFKAIEGDRLKTVPKGFDKEDPMLHYLQFKDLIVSHAVEDKAVTAPAFGESCVKVFKAMVPFNHFMNRPITEL